MGKPLTPAQRNFIDTHILNQGSSRRQEKKQSKAYVSYDNRRAKVQAEVDKIAPGHPLAAGLVTDLANAQNKATAGAFKGAYEDLRDVKSRARDASRNYFNGLPYEIARATTAASGSLQAVVNDSRQVLDDMDQLAAAIGQTKKVSECGSAEEAVQYRAGLTAQQVLWQGRIDTARTQMQAAAADADNLGIQAKLDSLARMIEAFRQNRPKESAAGDKAMADQLTTNLVPVNTMGSPRGEYITGALLLKAFEEKRYELDGLIERTLALGDLQQREPEPALKKFKALDRRDAKRMRAARRQMNKAMRVDATAGTLDGTGANPIANANAAAPFDVGDVLHGTFADLAEDAIDDDLIDAKASTAAADLNSLVQFSSLSEDELFDLSLKSPKDLERDIMRSVGWTRAELKDQPNRARLIQTVAQSVHDQAIANHPDKMADDGSNVTLGGRVYGNKQYLTEGGLGKIHRYTDAATNETIIVKSMNVPTKRNEMVREMRAHRQAMGGSGGTGHPNITDMKGVALSNDGTLHMLLEDMKGGDANTFFKSIQAASSSGLISPEVSAALTRRTMTQALQGVKALHQKGLMHLDIKAENFLMDENGTVKLADLGSATAPDPATGTVADRNVTTTELYAPPELRKAPNAVGGKGDMFWLGSMLQGAGSTIGIEGEQERPDNRFGGKYETFDVLRTGHGATAFDRLRDAMLDPDPAKRPTVDGALLSAYLADGAQKFADEDVEDLTKALVNYSRDVGSKVRLIEGGLERVGHPKQIGMNELLGELKRKEPQFTDNEPEASRRQKNEAFEAEKARIMPQIEQMQKKLEKFTRRRSDEELDALDTELADLTQLQADVASGATPGDAAALAQQLAELTADIADIRRAQPLLNAIAAAEAKLRTTATVEDDEDESDDEEEDEEDRLLRERLEEAQTNAALNARDGLNERIEAAAGSPRRARRQAEAERV